MIAKTLLGALLFVVLGAFVFRHCDQPRPVEVAPESHISLGREVGLTFPPSARILGVHREGRLDDLVAIKLELRADELSLLLQGSAVEQLPFEPRIGGVGGKVADFWDAEEVPGLRVAEAHLPQGRALHVGVSEARAGRVTVYVVNFGT